MVDLIASTPEEEAIPCIMGERAFGRLKSVPHLIAEIVECKMHKSAFP